MRGGVDEDSEPQDMSNKQVVALHQLLHEAKFKDPDKDHLSPAGILLQNSVSLPLCSTYPLWLACSAAQPAGKVAHLALED